MNIDKKTEANVEQLAAALQSVGPDERKVLTGFALGLKVKASIENEEESTKAG